MSKILDIGELGFEPGSLSFFLRFQGSVFKSYKSQHPSSREDPRFKLQSDSLPQGLMFGVWSFSGAWMLVLGVYLSHV
jgi:hypothetical protein